MDVLRNDRISFGKIVDEKPNINPIGKQEIVCDEILGHFPGLYYHRKPRTSYTLGKLPTRFTIINRWLNGNLLNG
jgi:hypothetical protein